MLNNETKELLLGYKTDLLAFKQDLNKEGEEIICFESPLLYDSTFPTNDYLSYNNYIQNDTDIIKVIKDFGSYYEAGLSIYGYFLRKDVRTDFEWLKLTVELSYEFSLLKNFLIENSNNKFLTKELTELKNKQALIIYNDVIYTLYSEKVLTESQAVSLMARTDVLEAYRDRTENKNSRRNMEQALKKGSIGFTPKKLSAYTLKRPKSFNNGKLIIHSLEDLCNDSEVYELNY